MQVYGYGDMPGLTGDVLYNKDALLRILFRHPMTWFHASVLAGHFKIKTRQVCALVTFCRFTEDVPIASKLGSDRRICYKWATLDELDRTIAFFHNQITKLGLVASAMVRARKKLLTPIEKKRIINL